MSEEPAPPQPPQAPAPSTLKKILRFPLTPPGAGISWVATLGAIVLSIYFYFCPAQHHGLSYYVQPAKTVIVRDGQLSRLSVTLDGKPITTDLTAALVTIWNGGNQSIRREHVLEPMALRTPSGIRIVDASIRKVSRSLVHAELDKSKFENGEVDVFWTILEGYDWIELQITYAGPTSADVTGSAVVEDQSTLLNKEPPPVTTKEHEYLKWPLTLLAALQIWFGGGMMLDRSGHGNRISKAFFLLAGAGIVIMSLYTVGTSFFGGVLR